jgi:hypothetical protein
MTAQKRDYHGQTVWKLDELREAVFESYAAIAEQAAKTGTEQQRRESALQGMDETLERHPLAMFSATHLELLELLLLIGARPRWQRMLQSGLRRQIRSNSDSSSALSSR